MLQSPLLLSLCIFMCVYTFLLSLLEQDHACTESELQGFCSETAVHTLSMMLEDTKVLGKPRSCATHYRPHHEDL